MRITEKKVEQSGKERENAERGEKRQGEKGKRGVEGIWETKE